MKGLICPGCGMEDVLDTTNPNWWMCSLCSWEAHPSMYYNEERELDDEGEAA